MSILAKTLSFLTILIYGNNSFAQSEHFAPRPVIVELYTSQGCSSCPPADDVLKYLKENNPNVIPLSMHVDYWNYIGWKDPFSSSEITQRQKDYNNAMKRRRIYTPQMVIDGKYQVIGSYYNKVKPIINKALQKTVDIPMSMRINEEIVEVGVLPHHMQEKQKADIIIIGYDSQVTTKVTRGENSGETLTNANVVKYMKKIGDFKGEKITVTSDIPDTENFLIILQETGSKNIIGVATVL
jgi:hypothetical protein